ncbi:hypothetical protein B0H15DRAFT_856148 [Mycena belliarum]|uniref:Uncharacterized protein n=1 Tax=Mycena belliarum TaxID=1033014 RepID=A0AAD6TWK5_9AGAR|nr:hypothetical protein B0H15DRAFT_856148 [Mycena belliae]
MSSRAASGRKRAPQTTTSNKPSRPGIDPNVQYTTFPTPVSPMHLRAASFSPSSSYAGLYPPTPSRDLIPRSQRSADGDSAPRAVVHRPLRAFFPTPNGASHGAPRPPARQPRVCPRRLPNHPTTLLHRLTLPRLAHLPLVPTYSPAPADSVSAYSPSTSPTSRSGSSDSISGSGGSGSASISTRSSDPHSPPDSNAPFVFPSSRSCARPGAGPGFKVPRAQEAQPAVQVLPAGTPIPAEGVFAAEAPPQTELPRRARSRPPPIVLHGRPSAVLLPLRECALPGKSIVSSNVCRSVWGVL